MFDRCDNCGKRVLFPVYKRDKFIYCSEGCRNLAKAAQQKHTIISCPSCGTRNRVFSYSDSVRPLCGKCKSPLPAPLDRSPKATPKSQRPATNRVGLLMVILVVGVLIGLVFTQHWGKGKGSEAPGVNRVASTPPKSTYAPPKPPETARPALLDRKLPSGTIIKSSTLNGNCQLSIENGLDKDAAVRLVKSGNKQCVVYFYVLSKSTHTVEGIPDGIYRLRFVVGRDWDGKMKCFTRDRACSEFDGPLAFETATEVRGNKKYYEYRGHRITLHKVPSGNAPAHGISESEFLAE